MQNGTMSTILAKIAAYKREEIAAAKAAMPLASVEEQARAAGPVRPFAETLAACAEEGRHGLIAEIKKASPSRGLIREDFDPASLAMAYAAGGAVCLSVLTDGDYFGGSLADLRAARAACPLPVLRKDFTLDAVQLYEARAAGADAILLITAALPDDALLADLVALAGDLNLSALVEADDEQGLERALAAGATLVGITNRDLRTFGEDLGTSERLSAMLPPGTLAVAESAIRSVDDARRMADAGFAAILVGEALVRSDDPEATTRAMASVPVPVLPRSEGS
jgi:indole-3-glycerol phosphate synthase